MRAVAYKMCFTHPPHFVRCSTEKEGVGGERKDSFILYGVKISLNPTQDTMILQYGLTLAVLY